MCKICVTVFHVFFFCLTYSSIDKGKQIGARLAFRRVRVGHPNSSMVFNSLFTRFGQ